MSFEILPLEMRMEIYKHLSLTSLVRMSRTCYTVYNDVQPYIQKLLKNKKLTTYLKYNPILQTESMYSKSIQINAPKEVDDQLGTSITLHIYAYGGGWKVMRFLSNDDNESKVLKLKSNMIFSERLEITGALLRSSWPSAVVIFEEIIKYLPNLCELSMPKYTWPQLYRLYSKSNDETKQRIRQLSRIHMNWQKIDQTMGRLKNQEDNNNFFKHILCPKIYSLDMWVKIDGIAPDFNLMPNLKTIDLKFCWEYKSRWSSSAPEGWTGISSECFLPNLEEFHMKSGYYDTSDVLKIISNSPKLHTLSLRIFRGACDIQPALCSKLFPALHTLSLSFASDRTKLQYCIDREKQVCQWPQVPNLKISAACCKKKLVRRCKKRKLK